METSSASGGRAFIIYLLKIDALIIILLYYFKSDKSKNKPVKKIEKYLFQILLSILKYFFSTDVGQ